MTQALTPQLPGFNYDFKPASYFKGIDPRTLVIASILGEERRKDVLARLESEDFDPLVWGDWLTQGQLDDSTRSLIGSAHPCFMGGEYLPALGEDEIEIARLVLASVTQDVISIRARRADGLIHYSVQDEYESPFILSRANSQSPLTLGELIGLIDCSQHGEDTTGSGLVVPYLDHNLEGCGNVESVRGFIAISSAFYPELEAYYNIVIDRYLDTLMPADEEEEAA